MSQPGGLSRRALLGAALAGAATLAAGCTGTTTRQASGAATGPRGGSASPFPSSSPSASASPSPSPSPASDAQIAARATVPVLCYHQLRDWRASDGAYARNLLICPPAHFRAQLDALAEGGYTTITPDQYLAHLTTGAPLPAKPVMLSFDDSQGSQITEGLPQLRRRHMTGTFFVMTVPLNKQNWMSDRDVKQLAADGMTVAAHTWDHHRVDRYSGTDWALQLEQPRALLEKLTGTSVDHFAYPYGAWKPEVIPHVHAAGYRTAFQLEDKPLDPQAPLYTLRRILMPSRWTGQQLLSRLSKSASTDT